jgi:hypothetical protein
MIPTCAIAGDDVRRIKKEQTPAECNDMPTGSDSIKKLSSLEAIQEIMC